MGYCITDKKPGESFDIISSAVYLVTDEEYAIAKKVFNQECESDIRKLNEALPEDLAKTVYFNYVAQYAHTVLDWLNKTSWYARPGACPCDLEDAIRREFTYAGIMLDIENCLAGKDLSLVYFYYKLPDDEVEKYQKSSQNQILGRHAKIINNMIPIESVAYLLIDFKDILPVRITNRKGFLYYCESIDDGQTYTVPCNRLFQTEEAAQNKIKERNGRRNTFIRKYHLLDESGDDNVNKKREIALSWLDLNVKPPKFLITQLREYLASSESTQNH